MAVPEIILASASPRREEMLRLLGLHFSILHSNVDEAPGTTLMISNEAARTAAPHGAA